MDAAVMNYFDRLVRRAVLQPARRPGAPLVDPFETVAEWPLDPPRAHNSIPDPHAGAAPAVPTSPLTPTAAPLVSPVAHRPAPPEAPPTSARLEPVLPPPPEPPPVQIARTPDEIPRAQRRGATEATNAPAVLPPLQVADRFLERLGVRVPEAPRIAERQAERLSSPAPSIGPAHAPAAAPLRHPPIVPAPPPPATRAAEPAEAARANAATLAGDDAGTPVAAARPAAVPREVVVVERHAVAMESRTRPRVGAGAPHFGLGQL